MPLINKLKEYRAKIDINQQELGSLVGASRQTISLIERGDYSPSILLALKIAQVFGARVDDIFILTEEKSDEKN
ncbi:MAG: helix-turn-helix transcriptional regulator [Oscillospiraceae bacterium]